jgi:hypothetical protein
MKLQQLTEMARRGDLEYVEKLVKGVADKVTVRIGGQESAKFTRIAKRYLEVEGLLEQLAAEREALNKEVKDSMGEYFDEAKDEVLTRVIETVSMTAQLAKKPKPSDPKEEVAYDKVVDDLAALLPDLKDKLAELVKLHTTIKPPPAPKSAALKIEPNFVEKDGKKIVKEGVADLWAKLKAKASALLDRFKSWGKGYDAKAADLKARIAAL